MRGTQGSRRRRKRQKSLVICTHALVLEALVGEVGGVVDEREAQVVLREVALRGRQLLAARVGGVLARRRVRGRRAVRHVALLV